MVATPVKTEVDTVEAEKMLAVLGIAATDPVVLCCYGETNIYFPARKKDQDYDWTEVTQQALEGRDWDGVNKQLQFPKTTSLGFISAPGGTAHKKRNEIKVSRLLVYEIDNEELADQWASWETAGLIPTLVMDSGNKSYHVWFLLDQYHPIEVIRNARERLSKLIKDCCGFTTDPAMHNPVQPARLAGGIHPATGKRSKIALATGMTYNLESILKICPEVEVREVGAGKGELFRSNPDDEELNPWDYPQPNEVGTVPLELAISKKSLELINTGQKAGAPTNRHLKYYSLSQSCQAAYKQLQELGYAVTGTPQELMDTYARNSGLDVQFARESHFENDESEFGCGELSMTALRRRIAKHATTTGEWRFTGKPEEPKAEEPTKKPAKDDSKIYFKLPTGTEVVLNNILKTKLDFFREYVTTAVEEEKNTLRRMVYIRSVKKDLKLNVIKDEELVSLVMENQDVLMNNFYRAIYAEERIKSEIPKVKWVVNDVIPEKDLTLVSGQAKTGKTRLVCQLVKSILLQEKFLGFDPIGKRKVFLILDDQTYADTAEILSKAGVWEHPDLIISEKFRLTEEQLDKLLDDIKKHPNAIVILDSLRSITVSHSAEENNAAMGMVLYDLKNQVIQANSTLVLIHHANQSNSVGVQSVSGHGSISGASNSVLTMHYLLDSKNLERKELPLRRLVREARSGKPFDLVVEMLFEQSEVRYVDQFQNFKLKEQQKTEAEDLSKLTIAQESLIRSMLETDKATSVIDLMRESKSCRADVYKRADFNKKETNTYTSISNKIKKLTNAGYVAEIADTSGVIGSGRRKLVYLTDEGKNFFAGLNGDY